MTRLVAVLSGLAAIILVAVTFFLSRPETGSNQFAQCQAGQVAGGADQIGGPFDLVSETGEPVTDKDVIDRPTLIYFGYSFCPDVCSIDAARNAVAVDILEEMGTDVKPVFISIDPGRDTPDVLKNFTEIIHPKMIGLTGSEAQVKKASQAYRTYYSLPADTEDPYYLVQHSTFTYLMLPDHGFADFFRREETPEDMAERVSCFVDAV